MKFDSVGRDACLPVQKIKHADAFDLDRNVGRLEAGGGREPGIELITSVGNARQKGAARANACGRWDLNDHREPAGILKHQMIVGITFQFVERQCGIEHPLRGFPRRHAVIGRDGIRRGRRPQCGNGCIGGRVQVDEADISVSPRLY